MPSIAEALDSIFLRPLDYLHPDRFVTGALFDSVEGRAALNRVLRQRMVFLELDDMDSLNPKARLWIRHWSLLPLISGLIGAQLQWQQLAREGAIQRLSDCQRAFARIDVGTRTSCVFDRSASIEQRVQAVGLNALMAWRTDMPEVLMERLPLQFSPRVVDLQQRLSKQPLNDTLYFLAVQHARIYQNLG